MIFRVSIWKQWSSTRDCQWHHSYGWVPRHLSWAIKKPHHPMWLSWSRWPSVLGKRTDPQSRRLQPKVKKNNILHRNFWSKIHLYQKYLAQFTRTDAPFTRLPASDHYRGQHNGGPIYQWRDLHANSIYYLIEQLEYFPVVSKLILIRPDNKFFMILCGALLLQLDWYQLIRTIFHRA